MSRLLKLSVNDDPTLSSDDILFIHIGYILTHGMVAYSTDVAVVSQPEYVLLLLGNVDNICYLCHVKEYVYNKDKVFPTFIQYSPDKYKNTKRKTWFLFDSMQKVPLDFLDELLPGNIVHEFIKNRANNKIIGEN